MAVFRWLCGTSALLFALAACGGSTQSNPSAGGGAAGTGGSSLGGSGGAGGGGGAPSGGSGGSVGGAGGGSCGPAAKTCAEPSECVLTATSCCLCGTPELTDFVAVNQAHLGECSCTGPVCECATMLNPNLGASCNAGVCSAFDVRAVDVLSVCKDDFDCTLRIGLDCCQSCNSSGYDVVSIRTDAESALRGMVCDSGPQACDACVPTFPPNAKAVCTAGRCGVVVQ